ncbi:hypothetical protein GSI_12169 [Ganoderma sinense ZZ0214-1]|uniref:Uncharacterized protein n=1 Tax=Ganoderma sinense ZZ0214-1 TaxID=1077348 RepID=A0A2G8RY29_9APHY|nr:hypothetical protein GSI_12169 [Ganoderma sinense ZZ0214-1]
MSWSTSEANGVPTGLPPNLDPASLLRDEVTWLVLMTTYTAFLVPIAVVLLFFSTPQLRRRPVFILNVCTLALGVAQGIVSISTCVNSLLFNLSATPKTSLASIFLFMCAPFCVQGILILRVLAAYPPKTLSSTRAFTIYGPIVLFKLARGANIGYWIFHLHQVIKDSGGLSTNTVFTVSQAAWTFPNTKAEWFLQLFDDMYDFQPSLSHSSSSTLTNITPAGSSPNSYVQRLKTLFWTAVFNFVFPVIFNIALLVLLFRDHDFVHGSYLLYTNNYVQIIGVLLATVFVVGRQAELKGELPTGQLAHSAHVEFGYATHVQSVGSSHSHLVPMESKRSRGNSEQS